MRTIRRIGVLVAATLLTTSVAACGSSSSTSSASAHASTAGSSAAGSSTAGSTAAAAGGGGSGDDSSFCALVKGERNGFTGTDMTSLITGGTPAAWKAYLAKAHQLNEQAISASPDAIRSAMQVEMTSADTLAAALASVDYKIEKLGAPKLLSIINSPQRDAANTTIFTYVLKHCGIDLTKAS